MIEIFPNMTMESILYPKKISLGAGIVGGIKSGFGSKQVWGSIHTPQNIIFINLKKNDTKEELEDTIIHELLHAKYTKFSEKKTTYKDRWTGNI